MSGKYSHLYGMGKQAAAVLTPEAEQAAVQPPMDPAMAGGAPAMDPMAAGGMPPEAAGGMPPMGGAPMAPPQGSGGQIPPEILQDQEFIQFLQSMGITLDPASGMFMGPDGAPVPPDLIVQAYQEFQTMQQGGGGMPPEAGMDPAMAGGMPPMPEGGMPMPPEGAGVPPEMGGEVPPEMGGAPEGGAPAEAPAANEVADAVMSGIEAVLQSFMGKIEKQISGMMDRIDGLKLDIEALRNTTDKRDQMAVDEAEVLRQEIEADLQPVAKVAKEASAMVPPPQPIKMPESSNTKKPSRRQGTPNMFTVIQGGK